MDDNSLYINIEAIDDASEVLIGVSDSAEEMAAELASAAQEANGALQTVSTAALDMATGVDEATASASDGMAEMASEAQSSGLETSIAMQNMESSILSASDEAISSIDELNKVMSADSEGISESAIAVGTSWQEAAEEVAAANEEIETSSAATTGGMAGLAAGLLLVSQYARQMSADVNGEITNAYKSTGQWNESMIELDQTLQNTGSSIPQSELTDFAKSMQSSTLFQQEAVLQAENLVMTHKDLQSSYQQIIGLSADLATKMAQQTGGTADLGNATKLLANAFSDPVTAMNRLITQAGVDIPYAMQQAIEKTAKAGDTAAASALLMQALNEQVGGLAKAAAGASGTGLTRLDNDFATMNQSMPGLTKAIDEFADVLDGVLKQIDAWVVAHPNATAVILITTAAMLGLVAVMTSVVALAILFSIGVSAGITAPIWLAMAAVVAIGGAIAALATVIALNWGKIRDESVILWGEFKTGFEEALNQVAGFFESWYNKIMGWINSIVSSVQSIGRGISGDAGVGGGAISSIIPHFASGGIVNGPTLALVGEAGPEAIIPLNAIGGNQGYSGLPSGFGNGSGGINVYVTGQVLTTEAQAKILGDMIAKQINRQFKLSTYK